MSYLTQKARQIRPYTPGLQPQGEGWIKLNTNENPYPPQIDADFDFAALRYYPDSECTLLRQKLAADLGVEPENIFVGNGSDEVLALAFQTFFSGKSVMMPDISYSFYPVWADMYDVAANFVATVDYQIDWEAYDGNCLIANPNAPTSLALEIKHVPTTGMVIIDEAYIDFARVGSAVRLIGEYDNLLVVRTFSKGYSLAGLRVGYAVGHQRLIAALNRMKHAFNSYPVGAIAQAIACSARPNTRRVTETREWLKTKLNCADSQTNFIWWAVEDAGAMYEYLLENKILVRYWPRFADRLRVTVGTQEEMEAFLRCVQRF